MKRLNTHTKNQKGFTLIELSIVLVIIGLIVGGVLVGQDLIRAAEIRATVSQLEKYNSAVNTFRGKYNGIPGDLQCTYRFQFGFTGGEASSCPASPAMAGSAGLGDGNGLIEATAGGTANLTAFSGEVIAFWSDLTVANLLDGSFGGNTASTTYLGAASAAQSVTPITASIMNQFVPPAKLGRGNYVFAFSPNASMTNGPNQGSNYFVISGMTTITAGAYAATVALTPIESRNIDSKIDDGLPQTGIVTAGDAASATKIFNVAATAASGKCVVNSTPAAYSVGVNGDGNTQLCTLAVRFN